MTESAKKSRRDRPNSGFTLVELLVVIAIIGVVASISIIATVTYREKAQAARVAQEVANFQKAVAVYYSENQRYPDPINSNYAEACYQSGTLVNGTPQKCCVSQEGCTYAGEDYATLEGGDFAAAARTPRWLTYLIGETAHAIFGGSMPSFLTEAPAVAGYKGVFYECASAACTNAYVYFSVPLTLDSCTRGVVHGGGDFFGVCAQDITGGNIDGSSGSGETENCANTIDDDGDGATDCEDADCDSHPSCAGGENCSTADDEDGDGFGQCDDSSCFGNATYCATETASGGSCSDGNDSDGDGATDCEDADCDSHPSCAGGENCGNDADDDGDGATDCEDADCAETERCAGVEVSCNDSSDNDGDGATDCEDADCAGYPSCAPPEDCGNGADDDGDGATDCEDADCESASGYCDCACETNECGPGSAPCYPGGDPMSCEDGNYDDPCYPNGDPMNCGEDLTSPCETNDCYIYSNDPCETNECGPGSAPCYPGGDPMSCSC